MNNFISFDLAENKIEYFFSMQHFIILLFSLILIVFFSMYASRQKFKFQKWFVFACTFLLILLETGRLVWNYFFLQHNEIELTFLNITNLNFFTLSLWISILVILISIAVKKKKDKKFSPLTFVFSISTIIAIINLIYPSFLNSNFEFYHVYNLTSVLSRSIIIMLGFFFVISKWINISKFLNFWKSFFSLVFFGMVCVIIYYFIGVGKNLFYLEHVPLFESLGIYLPFPLQFLLMGTFIIALQFLSFMPFYFYRKRKEGD